MRYYWQSNERNKQRSWAIRRTKWKKNPWRNTNGGILKGIRKLKLARLKNESKKNTGENIIQKLLHN